MSESSMSFREAELLEQYETPGAAEHYATGRWQQSRRARRSSAKEERIVGELLGMSGPHHTILDLPCGAGRFSQVLQAHSERLVRGDLAKSMLWQAAQASPTEVPAVRASAAAIPFTEASADMVFCFRLLHHFEHAPQRVEVLRELARVSRRWVIGTFFDRACLQAWRNQVRGKIGTRFSQSSESFGREAASAGLTVRRSRYLSKGISEQVVVLLEKNNHRDEVLLDLPSVRLERRTLVDGSCVAHKRYFFPHCGRRLEAAFRHTWKRPCRAQYEYENLIRLRAADVPTVTPHSWWCRRDGMGFVRDSWVASEWIEASSASDLGSISPAHPDLLDEEKLRTQLRDSIEKIHAAGCLYRGLHPRNVLITPSGPRWLDPAKCRWHHNPDSPSFQRDAAAEAARFWEEL
ncbi:MAG: hypothetical protein COB96_00865 [Planctomycetota bacterium]|nr:MAG: hypothetical protein COB96_00865 [Planctomycetota bacterium]